MIMHIDVKRIVPNPDQPRKKFPEDHIQRLAASIKRRGLIQAISVRPFTPRGVFMIVAGECRWMAVTSLGEKTIRCEVEKIDAREMKLRALVENVIRRDMNPMEEARAYQDLIDDGYDMAQIVEETGVTETIVRNRLCLIELQPEIQSLVTSGQLNISIAWAIAQVPRHRQTQMVRDVSAGKLRTAEDARHAAIAIRDAEDQADAFAGIPRASQSDIAKLRSLEGKVENIASMVSAGFKDGECVAARRVSPDRVQRIADRLALIRKHILQMEHDLRRAAVQGEISLQLA